MTDFQSSGPSESTPSATIPATVRRQQAFGDIYFIRCGTTGLIKIGVSDSAEDRLRELQTMSPTRLTLVRALREHLRSVERTFHDAFAAARHHGEWFRPTKELTRALTLSDHGLVTLAQIRVKVGV